MALKETKENLPLVLLWGDEHRDDSGKCNDCTCNADEKKCCYNIYDKPFLQELDKLAMEYPVDFYTEYAKDMASIAGLNNPKNMLFHHFLEQTTKDCHKKELRSNKNYENRCPTQNIRWHYSDPRFMKNTIERHAFVNPNNKLRHGIEKTVSYKTLTDSVSLKHPSIKQKKNALTALHEYAKNVHLYIYHTIHPEESERLYKSGFALFNDIVRIIIRGGSLESIFAVYVKTVMENDGISVVYKQIKRFSVVLQDPHELVTFLCAIIRMNYPQIDATLNYISKTNKTSHKFVEKVFDPSSAFDQIDSSDNLYQRLNFQNVIDIEYIIYTIDTFIPDIGVMFVELYALLRMLKPPVGSSTPFLTMGYFGATHTYQFANMLQIAPYFDYEVVYSRDNYHPRIAHGPDFRCITINTPIYLARDLEAHARAILSNPSHEKSYHNYRSVIRAERKGRLRVPDSDLKMESVPEESVPEESVPEESMKEESMKEERQRQKQEMDMQDMKWMEKERIKEMQRMEKERIKEMKQMEKERIKAMQQMEKERIKEIKMQEMQMQKIQKRQMQEIKQMEKEKIKEMQKQGKNNITKKKLNAINIKGLNSFLKKFPSRKMGGKARSKRLTRQKRQKRRTMKCRG